MEMSSTTWSGLLVVLSLLQTRARLTTVASHASLVRLARPRPSRSRKTRAYCWMSKHAPIVRHAVDISYTDLRVRGPHLPTWSRIRTVATSLMVVEQRHRLFPSRPAGSIISCTRSGRHLQCLMEEKPVIRYEQRYSEKGRICGVDFEQYDEHFRSGPSSGNTSARQCDTLLSLHTLRTTNSHDDTMRDSLCGVLVWQSMIRYADLHSFEIVGSRFPAPAWGTLADQPPCSVFPPEPHNTPTIR
jgi:hypothetical protein